MSRVVQLGVLIARAKVRRAGGDTLPILSMTMESGLVDQSEKFKKRIASADTAPYKRVNRGQLVVGFPIDEGVLSFQNLYDEAIVSPAYDVWDVCRPDLVDRRYLERVLRGPKALAYYRAKLQSTTARRRTLPEEVFLNFQVQLPHLHQQVDAVSLLEKVSNLRRKRLESIRLADEFLRALFYEKFGDPVTNSNRHATSRIDQLCEVATGSTPVRSRVDYYEGPHAWIKTGEVDTPLITSAEEYISDAAIAETNCKLFPVGTILIAMYGQGKTRGKVGMLGIPAATNQACAAILPSQRINRDFLYTQLSFMYEHLRAMGRGGNQENLNLGMIKSLEVLVPPARLVDEFLYVRQKVLEMTSKALCAQADSEAMEQSLVAKFFA